MCKVGQELDHCSTQDRRTLHGSAFLVVLLMRMLIGVSEDTRVSENGKPWE